MSALHRNNLHVIGQGARTLVFVNGFGCDQSVWRYLLPALSTRFRLVLFDQMGAGQSDSRQYDSGKYASLSGYVQDLLDICRELHLEQAVLVGHSVGATIGMLAAIREPGWFAQLLMLCPSPCYLNIGDYHGGFERQDLLQMLAFLEQDFSAWANSFASFLLGSPDRPALAAELSHSFCQNDPVIAKQFARVAFLADNRADVPLLRTPCGVVQCAEDVVAPREVGDFLLARLPHATLVTLPVAGHCPHLSAPTLTLRVLDDLLSVAAVA